MLFVIPEEGQRKFRGIIFVLGGQNPNLDPIETPNIHGDQGATEEGQENRD